MKRVFVQTSVFSKNLDTAEILDNPEAGKVIAGLGGVRKLRMNDVTYLIYMYSKDEAEDITKDEKKHILTLVNIIKGN